MGILVAAGGLCICAEPAFSATQEWTAMPSASDPQSPADGDLHAQLRQLREQVEALMAESVRPRAAEAVRQAEDLLSQGCAVAGEQLEELSVRVRRDPLTALAIAAVVGFLIGRTLR
jgi:ElaB/YqjD/DUF883 family membrane-anchored ribosome-binding protein